jgi:hypothetical protein
MKRKTTALAATAAITLICGALGALPANAVQTPWTPYSCTGLRAVTVTSSTTGWTAHAYNGVAPSGAGYSWAPSFASGGSRQTWSGMKSGQYSVVGDTILSYGASCYYL